MDKRESPKRKLFEVPKGAEPREVIPSIADVMWFLDEPKLDRPARVAYELSHRQAASPAFRRNLEAVREGAPKEGRPTGHELRRQIAAKICRMCPKKAKQSPAYREAKKLLKEEQTRS